MHHCIVNIFETNIGGAPAIFTIKTYFFASLLYWFEDFNTTYKSTKTATKRMLRIGRKFEINIKTVKEWGKSMIKDLSERCVSNIRRMGDVAHGINYTHEKLVIVLEQLRYEKKSNEELKENMCKFEGMITEMHSVSMDNHCANNESNKNNENNAK